MPAPRRPRTAVVVGVAVLAVLTGCTGEEPADPGAAGDSATPAAATPQPPDVRLGPVVWSSRTSPFELPQLVGVGDDAVLVGDLQGGNESSLVALNPDSGRMNWRVANPGVDGGPDVISYSVPHARVGPDGEGADEIVTLPYEGYTCPDGVASPATCVLLAGLEARGASDGEVRWRWEAPRGRDVTTFLTGTVVAGGVVVLWVGRGLLALDAATGERRWSVADALPPSQVSGDLAVVPPEGGGDGTYRVLDLGTGELVRSFDAERRPDGAVGSMLARSTGEEVLLEDFRSGEPVATLDEGSEIPPIALRSSGGLAWLTSEDRLLTLLPGEDEPVAADVPDGLDRVTLLNGFFTGDVGGGVMVVPTDDGLRTIGREGGVDEATGPQAVTVRDVTDGSVVLQAGTQTESPEPPLQVRPIR